MWKLFLSVCLAVGTLADSDIPSINYNDVPIVEKNLYQPPLQELADVLSEGLKSTFATVNVSVGYPPDLRNSPYLLTSPGLSGNPKLLEIGGTPYLWPVPLREKLYDLSTLVKYLHRNPAFLAGAGAGPWPYIGVSCEGIINLSIKNCAVDQGTRVFSVYPVGAPKGNDSYLQTRLPKNETRTSLMGNYLLSDGVPGDVIRIVVKTRIGSSDFVTAISQTLKNYYGDNVIGLGGLFVLRTGKGWYHVMPDFSPTPLCTDAEAEDWLHYFEMNAPITNLGTLVTGDLGLDLRGQHFHGFSAHGDGGHYHYDTTPEEVHYEGYFAVASSIIRIDQPTNPNDIGRAGV